MLEPTGANFGVGWEKRGVEKAFRGRERTRLGVEKAVDGGGASGVERRGGLIELLKRGERELAAQKREEKARRKPAPSLGEG
ncbi:MAG: hypothetical protein IKU86_08230, partial [Thermoguttaceae bacterium]|nr:hypothetical protein [Thermoguttaceae bacterium]